MIPSWQNEGDKGVVVKDKIMKVVSTKEKVEADVKAGELSKFEF